MTPVACYARPGLTTRTGYILAWLVLAPLCLASASADDRQFVSQDERLLKTITVARVRVCVGELLDLVSRDTAVNLRVSERDGSSDVVLLVQTRNMRLGDLMDRLTALLSYRGAQWSWTRDGKAGGFSYTLTQSSGARKFADDLNEWALSAIDRQVARLLEIADMPDEEQARVQDDTGLLPRLPVSEYFKGGLQLLKHAVPLGAVSRLIRGGPEVRLNVADLPDSARTWVAMMARRDEGLLAGPGGVREPAWVSIRAKEPSILSAPCLLIEIDGLPARAYGGGGPLEVLFRKRLRDLWMQPGDSTGSDVLNRLVPEPKAAKPDDYTIQPIALRLAQLAQAAHVPVLARVPADKGGDPMAPYGRTVGENVRATESTCGCMAKWRYGTLLVTARAWYRPSARAALAPWRSVRRLQTAMKERQGYLSLADVCWVSADLSAAQMGQLAYGFPEMRGSLRIQGFLAYLHQQRSARRICESPRGIRWTPDIAALFGDSAAGTLKDGLALNPQAIRIQRCEIPGEAPDVRNSALEVLAPDEKWLPILGLRFTPHVPPALCDP